MTSVAWEKLDIAAEDAVKTKAEEMEDDQGWKKFYNCASETENDHSSSQPAVHTGLTCPEGQSARAVTPSLSGEILALTKFLSEVPAQALTTWNEVGLLLP